MKVLVCDDIPDRCAEAVDKIRESGQTDPAVLVDKDLTTELTKLFENVRKCMDDPVNYKPGDESPFDGADIVILDNKLTELKLSWTRLTAESIAGYVRAFTEAPYVVSLNMNEDVDFDLRYLVGDFSTRADLALNTNHLANPSLWSGNQADAKDGFLPWYWPRLATVADRRRLQIEFVSRNLDTPVVEALGFNEEAIDFLSLHAKGALSPEAASDGEIDRGGKAVDKVTFRDVFIAKDRSLPFKEERKTISEVEQKASGSIREIISRVVAADIDLWFRRDVLGPQEPLVDIPHLLMRFPFLLGNRATDINEWNKAASAEAAPYGLDKKLYEDHLVKTQFNHEVWVPNPCFRWPDLKADDPLNECFFAAKVGDWADVVFCEDRSAFVERVPKGGEAPPIEFPAEFEGSWTRRYISRIEGIRYAPRSRLAL
jgi:hypothetical protein